MSEKSTLKGPGPGNQTNNLKLTTPPPYVVRRQHTCLPIIVHGARLRRRFLPALQLQVLVLRPNLGEGLIDVHRRLPGAVARRVSLSPVALVQGACVRDRY